jgi:pimeloyl-ACP methyl ester carboxylesterase
LDPKLVRVETEAAQVAARVWGEQDQPVVAFLHGLNIYSNALALNEAADVLVDEFGFCVVAIDAPGVGESPPAPDLSYEPGAVAELYLGALHSAGVERAHLLGFSWGASVAVEGALLDQDAVSGVALVDGAYWSLKESPVFGRFSAEGDEALVDFATEELAGTSWDSEEEWLAWLADALESELRPAVRRSALAAVERRDGAVRPRIDPSTYAAAIRRLFHWDLDSALARLGSSDKPVLVFAADDGGAFGEARRNALPRLERSVPNAEVVRLTGPHDLFLDYAEAIARIVGRWVAR